jgi:hypothetical protein
MLRNIDKNKLIVTQSNALALSAQKMTLQEKRLLLLLISNIRKDDDSFKLYYIPVNVIGEYLGINKTSLYSRISNISSKLIKQAVRIPEPSEIDGDQDGYMDFQWVSRSRYLPKGRSPIGEACLEMRLHEDLRPMLLNLKSHFGSVPLLQIATMPSFTSIRVVELLYFSSYGLSKKELYLGLDELKERLGIEGKYLNYKDFRREVLERAQKDCVEKSPITFTWIADKQGRKVIGLTFFIEKNTNIELLPPPLQLQENPQLSLPFFNELEVGPGPSGSFIAQEAMKSNGIEEPNLSRLLAAHDPEQIIENCKISLMRFQDGKVNTTLPAYTVGAIKADYRPKKTPVEKETAAKKDAQLKATMDKKIQEKELEDFRAEFDQVNRDKLQAIFDSLSEVEQSDKLKEFRKTESTIMKKLHAGKGLDNAGLKMAFFSSFAKEALSPMEQNFISWMKRVKGKEIIEDKIESGKYIFNK